MTAYDLFLATTYGQALYLRGLKLSSIFILRSDNNKPLFLWGDVSWM